MNVPRRALRWLLAIAIAVAGLAPALLAGDADCDGILTDADRAAVVAQIFGAGPLPGCDPADANGDGHVSAADLVAIVRPAPTPTPTPGRGPQIVFFGIVDPEGKLPPRTPGTTPEGVPVYDLTFGFGFSLVVEARPGESDRLPGSSSYNQFGPPDLQIQATMPLGDGSPEVCDDSPPIGGVPGFETPNFDDQDPAVVRALNDFGCRFLNGSLEPGAFLCDSGGCVLSDDATQGCVSGEATHQFCGSISKPLGFPPGRTVLTVRVLDRAGEPGPTAQLVIRVATPTAP